MVWSPALPSTLALAIAVVFGVLALVGWRRRDERCAGAFVGLTAAFAFWSLSYGFQLGFTTAAEQVGWWRAGLAFGSLVAPAWVLFGIRYAGKDDWITPDAVVMLFAEPLAYIVLVSTNDSHHFIWSSIGFQSGEMVAAISPILATGYYLHVLYHYALIAFGSVLLLSTAYHSLGLYRRQAIALLLTTVPAIVANVSFTVGRSPVPGVDLTPFASVFTVLGVSVALFNYDMLNRTPIARETALEAAGGGLLVLDSDGMVVDADNCAHVSIDVSPVIGRSFDDLFPEATLQTFSGTVIESRTPSGRRYDEGRIVPLDDDEGQFTGYSVVFRDVTDRRAYEQRLEVANRVLRHNLRNDMNLVEGVAARIESGESTDTEADARLIRKRAERVVELGEKARVMTRSDPESGVPGQIIDVGGPIERVVSAFAAREPGAHYERAFPDSLHAVVTDQSALQTALRELIENAIEHTEAAELPLVRIEGVGNDELVTISVVDDGPGIPPSERDVLRSGTETPLHHGGGMGLW
jgi:signal transduction histidine kinase